MNRVSDEFNVETAPQTVMVRNKSEGPRLLVSVRSRHEAECALAGGAEILDVKEPSLGSLGMASVEETAAIATIPEITSGEIPLSVALGELADWPKSISFPRLPAGLTFAKLGLSECALNDDWQADWLRVRAEFERRSASTLSWVAVAYSDSVEAGSPAISEVLNAAIETNCAGLLIDTWIKDGRVLLHETKSVELAIIANKCHESGLFLALAGRLNCEVLPDLVNVAVDVIAIRSAACRGDDRTSELDSQCVALFKQEMQRCDRQTRTEKETREHDSRSTF